MAYPEQTSIKGLFPIKNTATVNGNPATLKRVWDGKKWINRIEVNLKTENNGK